METRGGAGLWSRGAGDVGGVCVKCRFASCVVAEDTRRRRGPHSWGSQPRCKNGDVDVWWHGNPIVIAGAMPVSMLQGRTAVPYRRWRMLGADD